MTDEDEIILVKQFRKPVEKAIYEVPAGKLDNNEDHRHAEFVSLRRDRLQC